MHSDEVMYLFVEPLSFTLLLPLWSYFSKHPYSGELYGAKTIQVSGRCGGSYAGPIHKTRGARRDKKCNSKFKQAFK